MVSIFQDFSKLCHALIKRGALSGVKFTSTPLPGKSIGIGPRVKEWKRGFSEVVNTQTTAR